MRDWEIKAGPDYRVGNRETGKRGSSVPGLEHMELNSVERRKFKNEHNCRVNNNHTGLVEIRNT